MSEHAVDPSEARKEPTHAEQLSWRTDPRGEQPTEDGARRLLTVRMAVGLMDALRAQRPDWGELEIMAALDTVRHYPPTKTFQAALNAAYTPGATPDLIGVGGRHWDSAGMLAPLPDATPAPVHRPKRSKEQRAAQREWTPAWRSDPAIQETRALAAAKDRERREKAGGLFVEA